MPAGHSLRFENVSFGYPGRAPVLQDLSLEIPAGRAGGHPRPVRCRKIDTGGVGVAGGCARDAGRVLLGGVDIATLGSADVHSAIAWLSQGTTLFEDTIRANLALSRPDASDEALWHSLDDAGIADVVRELPDGLDTWMGSLAAPGLSGGQARRVALARTLLSSAPILVLDEPATGLDPAAERAFSHHPQHGDRGAHGDPDRASADWCRTARPDLAIERWQSGRGCGLGADLRFLVVMVALGVASCSFGAEPDERADYVVVYPWAVDHVG